MLSGASGTTLYKAFFARAMLSIIITTIIITFIHVMNYVS